MGLTHTREKSSKLTDPKTSNKATSNYADILKKNHAQNVSKQNDTGEKPIRPEKNKEDKDSNCPNKPPTKPKSESTEYSPSQTRIQPKTLKKPSIQKNQRQTTPV